MIKLLLFILYLRVSRQFALQTEDAVVEFHPILPPILDNVLDRFYANIRRTKREHFISLILSTPSHQPFPFNLLSDGEGAEVANFRVKARTGGSY